MATRTRASNQICGALLIVTSLFVAAACDGAEKVGVIELGSKGIKAVHCEITSPRSADRKPVITHRSKCDADLMAAWTESAPPERKEEFEGQQFDNACLEIEQIIGEMTAEGIVESRIFVFLSSGLYSVCQANGERQIRSRIRQRHNGINVDKIDVKQETEFVFSGLSHELRDDDQNIIILDIGSGNAKGTFRAKGPDQPLHELALGKGVKSFTQQHPTPEKLDQRFWTEYRMNPIRKELTGKRMQQLLGNEPTTVLVVGGIAFVAGSLEQGHRIIDLKEKNTLTASALKDLTTLVPLELSKADWDEPGLTPASVFDEQLKKLEAFKDEASEIEAIYNSCCGAKEIFAAPELKNGHSLLKNILNEIRVAVPKSSVPQFVVDSLYALPLGYCTSKLDEIFGPVVVDHLPLP